MGKEGADVRVVEVFSEVLELFLLFVVDGLGDLFDDVGDLVEVFEMDFGFVNVVVEKVTNHDAVFYLDN